MRRPSTTIVPAVGVSSPPIRLSSVVLPEPDGPMSATKSPRGMSRSMPCSTSIVSPPRRYVFVTPRISTRTFMDAGLLVGEPRRRTVPERGRRRDDHALARAHAVDDLALRADALARRHRAALHTSIRVDEQGVPAYGIGGHGHRGGYGRARGVGGGAERRHPDPHIRHDARILGADRDAHLDRGFGAIGGRDDGDDRARDLPVGIGVQHRLYGLAGGHAI